MTDEPVFPLLNYTRLRMGIDGSGVTTLVAGAGCPLHCRWCINKKLLREAPVRSVTAEELFDLVKVDDLYFRATCGGVTFGGGESLLHTDFITCFKDLIPADWRITAETSLAVPHELLLSAAKCVDMFIVDCKDMEPEIYHRYTGGDAALMTENLLSLLELAGPERILVRVPKIPDFNTDADMNRSLEKLRDMGVKRFDVFDYVVRED